ncbi:transmembrane glucosamine N-acetyltransferase NagX [Thalassotalea fusca]
MTDTSTPALARKKQRLLSIDALRGFDMVWIIGAEKFFAAFFVISGWVVFDVAAQQMNHTPWHGFTAYDLIFPLFIFLSGVSLGIAAKPLATYPPEQATRILLNGIKRLILLVLLGIIYNHGWGTGIPLAFDEIRFASVLGRIGVSWFFAALIVWYLSERAQWITALAILIGYWLVLTFVSIGDYGGGNYSANGALNVWFDQTLLPGSTYLNQPLDPEGILSNIPSVVNALAGVFVGRMMKQQLSSPRTLLVKLLVVGVSCLLIGYGWGSFFPINKVLWTSSFVLVTVGYSTLLLAIFYGLIDVLNWRRWAKVFAVIGTNSIIVYLGSSLINWSYISSSLFGGVLQVAAPGWRELVLFGGMVLLQWLVLYWLYRQKIFIKV